MSLDVTERLEDAKNVLQRLAIVKDGQEYPIDKIVLEKDGKIEVKYDEAKKFKFDKIIIKEDVCKEQAIKEVDAWISKLKPKEQNDTKNTSTETNVENSFREKMIHFIMDRMVMEADKVIAKITVDLDYKKASEEEKLPAADSKKAKPKHYEWKLTSFAIAGLCGIVILIVLAGICVGSVVCGIELEPVLKDGKQVYENGMAVYNKVPRNIPLQILESQFMLAIIGGVIAPMVVRVLKEKYDINIAEAQVSMVVTDAIKAVRLYQNEANKLRDKDGYIPDEYQGKLRDLAISAITKNYDLKKYNEIIANVGAPIFQKAVEEAVKRGWIENFAMEKEQVEAIIRQSIDAIPQIVEWKNFDEKVKIEFLDGHVKRLLANVGLDGWGREKLEEIFGAETNKRLLAAGIADAKDLLTKLDPTGSNKYMKYTSTVFLAAGESIANK